MSTVISRSELAKHATRESAWVVIRGKVYDVTNFAKFHPGGAELLLTYAGKDCTEDFEGMHRNEVIVKYSPRLLVGILDGANPKDDEIPGFGDISAVPYAEHGFYQGQLRSTYLNDSHLRFKSAVRQWFAKEYFQTAVECELNGKYPTKEMYKKLGDAGILAASLGPGPHLKLAPNGLPGGIKPEEFDYFHDMILVGERARTLTPGYNDGTASGIVIGLPVVINYGAKWMQEEIVRPVIQGEKIICLGITEPFAGSDVAALRTTAVKDPTGQYYIVNGVKKWITNAVFCDYMVCAVRTGGDGQGGISMLLIERTEGVTVSPIKTSYSPSAGTGYIVFENVKVPVRNLIGQENQGFKLAMANFNHERLAICAGAIAVCRYITEECVKWMNQRKTFGKKLTSQPVLVEKLAECMSGVEAADAWMHDIIYQMNVMSYKEWNEKLGGKIALLKFFSTNLGDKVSGEAVQIFGGRGITATGMGQAVQRFSVSHKFMAVYGGSREIMANLGVTTALRSMPKNAKL